MRIEAGPLALFLGAGLVYWGGGVPSQQEAARADAERVRVAAEGDELRAQVRQAQRRQDAALRIGKAAPAAGRGDVLNAVRRSLLETLKAAPVADVRLTVTRATPPAAVRAQISAEGRFEDLVDLCARIGPNQGFLPEQLRWRPTDKGATLDMTAVSLEAGP